MILLDSLHPGLHKREMKIRVLAIPIAGAALAAANGLSASLAFQSQRIAASANGRSVAFPTSAEAFPRALEFVANQTNDRPNFASYVPGAKDHSAHFAMMPQAAAPQPAAAGP